MRRVVRNAVVGAAVVGAGVVVERRCIAAPHYHGPVSDHFDGERFRNREQSVRQGSFWKWQFTREPGFWPGWVDEVPGAPPPRRVGEGRLRVTFINHATLLVQMDDLNVLTDPIWSERTSPFSFISPASAGCEVGANPLCGSPRSSAVYSMPASLQAAL